jgi:hypothetical protein
LEKYKKIEGGCFPHFFYRYFFTFCGSEKYIFTLLRTCTFSAISAFSIKIHRFPESYLHWIHYYTMYYCAVWQGLLLKCMPPGNASGHNMPYNQEVAEKKEKGRILPLFAAREHLAIWDTCNFSYYLSGRVQSYPQSVGSI